MEHADWPDLGPVTFWPWREEGALLQPFGENGWGCVHTYQLSQGSALWLTTTAGPRLVSELPTSSESCL